MPETVQEKKDTVNNHGRKTPWTELLREEEQKGSILSFLRATFVNSFAENLIDAANTKW